MGVASAFKLSYIVVIALLCPLLLTTVTQQSLRAAVDGATTWVHPHVSAAAAALNNVDLSSLGLTLSIAVGNIKAFLLAAWLKVAVTAQAVWSTVGGFEGWTDAGAAVFGLPSLPWIAVSVVGLLAFQLWWWAQTRRQVGSCYCCCFGLAALIGIYWRVQGACQLPVAGFSSFGCAQPLHRVSGPCA